MTTEPTQLRRDPFARASLMRETLPKRDRSSCAWCGQPGRFAYYWVGDGGGWQGRPEPCFCSVGCWESYNG